MRARDVDTEVQEADYQRTVMSGTQLRSSGDGIHQGEGRGCRSEQEREGPGQGDIGIYQHMLNAMPIALGSSSAHA